MGKNNVQLDKLDFAILSFLQQDGRMSFTVMAKKLKVSIGTIRTRFNKLIDEKTVSIIGRVSPEKVGFCSYAHIAVYIRPATLKEKVAQKIVKLPEVSFLAMTSGDYDLEVDVKIRKRFSKGFEVHIKLLKTDVSAWKVKNISWGIILA